MYNKKLEIKSTPMKIAAALVAVLFFSAGVMALGSGDLKVGLAGVGLGGYLGLVVILNLIDRKNPGNDEEKS